MSTIRKWGNSLAVRIPGKVARQLRLSAGTPVEILAGRGSIVVRLKEDRRYTLNELLKDCRPAQLHGETEFGKEVGREVLD